MWQYEKSYPFLIRNPRVDIITLMKYRRLGRTELSVSEVGLGTYQFGGSWGKKFSGKEVKGIFEEAEVQGINFVDTAECYGVGRISEKLVGSAIDGRRDRWIIATKFGHRRIDEATNTQAWSAPEVQQQLEDSLRALGTDYPKFSENLYATFI